jgi:hypothetical protein
MFPDETEFRRLTNPELYAEAFPDHAHQVKIWYGPQQEDGFHRGSRTCHRTRWERTGPPQHLLNQKPNDQRASRWW